MALIATRRRVLLRGLSTGAIITLACCAPAKDDDVEATAAPGDGTGVIGGSAPGAPDAIPSASLTSERPACWSMMALSDVGDVAPASETPREGDAIPEPATTLEPGPGCVHPEIVEECANGFCCVPPGCFVMGAPRDELGVARYLDVQIQVTLTHPFALGQYEVTYAEWLAEGFSEPSRVAPDGPGDCREDACPITNVNLMDALAFANVYSENRDLAPCYELSGCVGEIGSGPICGIPDAGGRRKCTTEGAPFKCKTVVVAAETVYDCEGYRLPTEAEWEYATRAGTRSAFWTGNLQYAPVGIEAPYEEPNLVDIAWYSYNSGSVPHVVGTRKANPWGFFDLLGNAQELTTDLIVFDGLGCGREPRTNPVGRGLEARDDRALFPVDLAGEYAATGSVAGRGGSIVTPAAWTKASTRLVVNPIALTGTSLGFRLARTLR